ncbi:MAG TPA: RNA polymerase sigma factor [Bryobacteraceae bacterium]|nr:RNA polymerase sigma factor [Bryobacteraceae bacterium]
MDESLLDELRAAPSEACFTEIFNLNRRAVLTRCRRMLGDPSAAEDLAQETFAVAFAKLHLFRGGVFSNWILQIARNRCINYLRASLRTPEAPLADDTPSGLTGDSADDLVLSGQVSAVLRRLPPEQRVALKLFYADGYNYKEIARFLGCPEKRVKSHLQNGRKHFRSIWEETEGGSR